MLSIVLQDSFANAYRSLLQLLEDPLSTALTNVHGATCTLSNLRVLMQKYLMWATNVNSPVYFASPCIQKKYLDIFVHCSDYVQSKDRRWTVKYFTRGIWTVNSICYHFCKLSIRLKLRLSPCATMGPHAPPLLDKFAFLNHPLGELEVTYGLCSQLVGKCSVNFLLAIIELFPLALTVEAS